MAYDENLIRENLRIGRTLEEAKSRSWKEEELKWIIL